MLCDIDFGFLSAADELLAQLEGLNVSKEEYQLLVDVACSATATALTIQAVVRSIDNTFKGVPPTICG